MKAFGINVFAQRAITPSIWPRPLFSVRQGWTPQDIEVTIGPWDIIISRINRKGGQNA